MRKRTAFGVTLVCGFALLAVVEARNDRSPSSAVTVETDNDATRPARSEQPVLRGGFPIERQPGWGFDTPTTAGCELTEVNGFLLGKVGTDIEFTWQDPGDPCLDGYGIAGSDTPVGGFSTEVETGTENSVIFDPSGSFFIVYGTSGGNTGPWGH